jgi:ElaA protein
VIRVARFAELDAPTLFGLLRLRQDVFVVEQDCVYPDIDERDIEPRTLHMWAEDGAGGTVTSCLRLLDDGDHVRIGRVCTAADARRRGLAAALIARALELVAERTVVIDAQAHLADWYATFGFEVCGAEFVEDGILHVPMRRT